ncbi:MAG: DNA translocase FtsK [Anaerolineae bacterium]|nr:DNA translocase FtsK [Anaerolineae bacterium]
METTNARPPIDELEREVQIIGHETMRTLARLGFCRELPTGELDHIKFSRIFLSTDAIWAAYEVDSARVPRGVRLARVISDDTLHELTIALKHHVHRLNTTGATLAVELDAGHRRPLPRRVALDVAGWPDTPYLIPVGLGHGGPELRSLLETSHILVGGESRSGKSTWLNTMLVALLLHNRPSTLQLALVDPKGVEFVLYRDIPHLYRPVAVEQDAVIATVEALVAEMDHRQKVFHAALTKNLSAYNARAAALRLSTLPLVVAVIDEVTDLAMLAGKAFTDPLTRLASKAASFGIVLVLSTQNPKAEVLNTLIKGNMSVRVAFRVATPEHSRVILGVSGAEGLPRTARGRMMARLDADLVELQGYFVRDEWVAMLTNRLRGYRLDPQMDATVSPAATPVDEPHQPQLTDLQRRLVQYAIEELDGAFSIGRLFKAFRNEISKPDLSALAQTWERHDWLSAPAYQGAPRLLTPALCELSTVCHPEMPLQINLDR